MLLFKRLHFKEKLRDLTCNTQIDSLGLSSQDLSDWHEFQIGLFWLNTHVKW